MSGDDTTMTTEGAARIHEASLALLAEPGVRIEHDDLCRLLLRSGAGEGDSANVIRFPAEMVTEALAAAPRTVTLCDQAGKETVLEAEGPPMFWSCPGLYVWEGGARRPCTADDLAGMARLLQKLPQVGAIFGMSLADVPPGARDVVGLRVIAENSRKHVRVLSFSPEGAEALVRMRPVVGEYPWFSMGFTAHGPLRWTHLALEIFRRTAAHGIPVSLNGEPAAGVSGPVTLAGAAAVGNAEILAALVVNQLLEPGRPCLYNLGLAHIFDMRTAIVVTGAPENHLLAEISAAMGRFYGLPSASWVSTEAMAPDAQAALEKMLGWHTHLTSGVSAVWGVGQLESEMTFSPAQAVLDDEMIGLARRYRRGVEVTEEALALEVTRQVGIGGSFLESEHTLRHFRTELHEPQLLWRKTRERWEEEGARSLEERAEEKARALWESESESNLTEEQRQELGRIVTACSR